MLDHEVQSSTGERNHRHRDLTPSTDWADETPTQTSGTGLDAQKQGCGVANGCSVATNLSGQLLGEKPGSSLSLFLCAWGV